MACGVLPLSRLNLSGSGTDAYRHPRRDVRQARERAELCGRVNEIGRSKPDIGIEHEGFVTPGADTAPDPRWPHHAQAGLLP